MPLAPRWLDQVVDLPAVLLNHCVQLLLPAALEQVSLDSQNGAGSAVEGSLRKHQLVPA
jgi:hypothetical protein